MMSRANARVVLKHSAVLAAILGSFLIFPQAQAAEQTGYLGFLGGVNIPNGNSDSSKSATVGIELGTKLTPQFGVGFFGTYYGQDNNSSFLGFQAGTHTHTINAAAEANIFAGNIFHFGADVGEAFTGASVNAGSSSISSSGNNFICGPEGGFDIPIAATVTMGGEAHYLLTSGSNTNNNLLLLAALKIWF